MSRNGRDGKKAVKKERLKNAIGILLAFQLIWILLVFAIEFVCYSDFDYYAREYEKYDVLSALPKMELYGDDGLMAVTEHMMKYLRGNADAPKLQIEVSMGGVRRGFFTERELWHMEDVRGLFVGAKRLSTAACIGSAILLAGLVYSCRDRRRGICWRAVLEPLCRGMLRGTLLFLGCAAVLGAVIAANFTEAFLLFHRIFFTNDLWLLDPRVDMLVNIVPEGFFYDTAVRIVLVFTGGLLLLLGMSAVGLRLCAKRAKQPRGKYR